MSNTESNTKQLKFLSKGRIYLAVCIGLGISAYLLYNEASKSSLSLNFSQINWQFKTFLWLLVAVFMMVIRDLAYVIRIKLLSEVELTWEQSLKIVLVWEFASALSPGVVGGSAVALFILNKENISIGKSTTLVLTTTFLDNLFYVLAIPLILTVVLSSDLIPASLDANYLNYFWIGYGVICLITLILFVSLFIYPQVIKLVLNLIYRLPILNKRKHKAVKISQDVEQASKVLKSKNFSYWVKLVSVTFASWTARFLVVNFVVMAFVSLTLDQNLVILGRQLLMWLVLLVSPTPGGSGVAEYLFGTFLKEFMPLAITVVVGSFIWRLISYYPYLFIGAIILPKWFKK
jgi:uncharacterized protein (TIRG00374 family)